VALLLLPLAPACTCSGNGHVEQARFFAQPGDDVVNCNCNLSFDNEHCSGGTCFEHFAIQLCLPLGLQLPAPPDLARPRGDMGPDPYSAAVDRYCRDTVTNVVYHMIQEFNGGWCMYKAPFAPDGGIGSSVACFAMPTKSGDERATSSDDGTCRKPCAVIPCDYDTNCGQGVQDATGNVHPENCKCSIVTNRYCPGDAPDMLPTAVFCRPPAP
jgi:hypothetical protein